MARVICGWPVLAGLVLFLIGCTGHADIPKAVPTLPAGIATPLPRVIATPTNSHRVTATELPTPMLAGQDGRFTVYGFRAEDSIAFNAFSALAIPGGQEMGTLSMDQTAQGAFFAFATQTKHAYVLTRAASEWQLVELTLPTMRVVKRTPLNDGVNTTVGMGRGLEVSTHGLAVSIDGREVYAETARAIDAHTEYAIAVYDVDRGAFVRSIPLGPECGVASLFALPDRQLLVRCPTIRDVLWLDTRVGRVVAGLSVGGLGAVLSRDRRVLWIVADNGHLFEIDVTKRAITWTSELSDGLAPIVPNHQPHLSADEKRLFVLAAPGPTELWRQGLGSEVWILETVTFHHIADVKLPTPAYDFIPSPDGRQLVITTLNWDIPGERGSYLMDIGTGRELNRWPWALVGMQTSDGGG